MYVLLVYRPEAASNTDLNDPFDGIEVLFISSSEEDLNREIDHHKSLGRDWKFHIESV